MQNQNKRHTNFENMVRLRAQRRDSHADARVDKEEVIAKVVEDINFLRDRIAHIKRANRMLANPIILKTYKSMLESRESVLDSLLNQQDNSFKHEQKYL